MSYIAEDATIPTDAEIVIVGAGMAGLAVAAELEEVGGPAPLLVEAGPNHGLDHYLFSLTREGALAYWLTPEVDPDFWRPYESADDSFGGIAGLRRRTGGRSLYWHGVALPMDSWALESGQWPATVRNDLCVAWQGGLSLYERTTAELLDWSGRGSLAGTQTAELAGYSLGETPVAARQEADGRWRVYSPLERWRERERIPPVLTGSRVLGLLTEGRRVAGLRVTRDDVTSDIHADKVVLAAGTVENSRLLIQALHGLGCISQPRLTNLADKISHGFVVVLSPRDVPSWLADAASHGRFFVARADPALRSNLFVRTFISDQGAVGADVWLMGEQVPGESGYVRCDDSASWPWPVQVGCQLSPRDRELAEAQRAELARICAVFSAGTADGIEPLHFDESAGLRDLPRRLTAAQSMCPSSVPVPYVFPLGAEQHESGTLPMGQLVDSDQRCRDLEGVFAAGPCIFPRPGAANPALTILALAKRLAWTIASES